MKILAVLFILLSAAAGPASGSNRPDAGASPRYDLQAMKDEWRWVRFTRESGLPSNNVYQVTETRDGKVWAATKEGLAWYDGFEWRLVPGTQLRFVQVPHYFYPYSDTSLIVGNFDGIWIVTQYGIVPYRCSAPGDGSVMFAVRLADGSDFVQTSSGYYRLRNGVVAKAILPLPPVNPLHRYVWLTRSGMLWYSTGEGLFSWDGNRWTRWMQMSPGSVYRFQAVGEVSSGRTIFSLHQPYARRGVWEADRRGAARRLFPNGLEIMRLVDTAPDGEMLAVFESGEVTLFDGRSWSLLTPLPSQFRNVSCLRFRANGDLWVATESGLSLFRASAARWQYWKHPFPDPRNAVNEILRAHDGSFWMATSGGVEIRRPDGASKTITRIGSAEITGVTGLGEDADGNIWISSGSDFPGAYCWNGTAWRYAGAAEGFGHARIHKIRKDLHGRLWFLGLSPVFGADEPGAFVLDRGKFTRWGAEEGLLDGRVYSFAESPDGSLWFGTLNGLSRWRAGVWKRWKVGKELHGNRIFVLAVDRQGTLWFDDELGLARIDTSDTPAYFPESAGLRGREVWDMRFEESGGALWLTTRNFGSIIRYQDGAVVSLGLADGLNNENPWPVVPLGNSVYIGTDGGGVNVLTLPPQSVPVPQVVIAEPFVDGSQAHLSWAAHAWWGEVSPAEIRTRYRLDEGEWSQWSTAHEARFSSLSAGRHALRVEAQGLFGVADSSGSSLQFETEPPLYARPLFALPIVLLSAAVGSLSLLLIGRRRKHTAAMRDRDEKMRLAMEMTASAIFIFRGERIRFANSAAEELTGYSRKELEERGFKQLAPGAVEKSGTTASAAVARNGEGSRRELTIQTKDGADRWIEYTLRPVLFEDGPAHLGTAFDISERKRAEEQLFAYRDKLKSLASELLLTEERERRKMAEYLHDTISQGLAFCKMKLAALRECESPEELHLLVLEINALVNESIEQAQTLTFELSPPVLYELGFADAVEWLGERMGKQFLLSVAVRSDNLPKALGPEIRTVLFHAIREALFNVAKHAQTAAAEVVVRRSGDDIVATVSDGGRGFDVHTAGQTTSRGGGFGLFNVRERLSRLGGSLDVSSTPGKGTTVTIRAPLGATPAAAGKEEG